MERRTNLGKIDDTRIGDVSSKGIGQNLLELTDVESRVCLYKLTWASKVTKSTQLYTSRTNLSIMSFSIRFERTDKGDRRGR